MCHCETSKQEMIEVVRWLITLECATVKLLSNNDRSSEMVHNTRMCHCETSKQEMIEAVRWLITLECATVKLLNKN